MRTDQKCGSVVENLALLAGLAIVLGGPVRSAAAQGLPDQGPYARQQFMQQPNGRPSQFGAPRQNGPPRQFAPQKQSNRLQNDPFNRQQNRGPAGGNPLFVGPNRPEARSPDQFVDPRQAGYGANSQSAASPVARKEPIHSKFVVELTDNNFRKQVLRPKQPVLVDIWAPWCGPCKAISPMIDEIAEQYAGTLKVGKLNLDECPEVAKAFNVEGLPTLLIFNRGELVDSLLGAVEKEKLEEALEVVMPQ